jgi:exodeoxyribonuclease VII large subunit
MNSEFFRVSELNQFIKDVISAGIPQPVWVCGELQQFDRNRSKTHIFFELVEKDEKTHDIIARTGLVIFANRKQLIESRLKKADNSFELKDDIEVKFLCKVDFYSPHGAVRLIVEDIDPFYTLGKLAQERLKLIAQLKEKGVLDKNKKLELSEVPLNIGLITAYDSAAYNDFISELKRSSLGFTVYLRNAVMQGKRTEADVINAMAELQDINGIDALIITRGGGSIAELSCFDSAKIAETIAAARIPVISGIGHEINTTITDLAAHTFLKTPTAVAQFLIERVRVFLDKIEALQGSVLELGKNLIDEKHRTLREDAYRLHNGTNCFLREHEIGLVKLSGAVTMRPAEALKEKMRLASEDTIKVNQAIQRRFQNEIKRLTASAKMIDVLRPEHTLKRGFSITRDASGKALRTTSEIKEGEVINTDLFEGKLQSIVNSIKQVGK